MADYTLSAKITGDSSGFEKAFSTAQKTVDNFQTKMKSVSSKLDSIGSKLTGMGAKMTVGLTTPITLAGKSMVNAASDFDENLNKVNVAFGDSADAVTAWADNATKQFGLSKNQALEATSLFGDMATSMGLTQPAAADMSMSLAGLAGDLASFKNIGIDQAMTALAGVFTGETESLKQLGIVMTETNLEEFAAQTGLVYNEMSQAEKVQLRYNYVMAMAANAQGDYARTSDGTANSLRTFQGAVDNLNIALGQHLLPTLTPLVQKATEMVNAFAEADPKFQQVALGIAAVVAVAGPLLVILGGVFTGASRVVSVLSLLSGPVAIAIAAIAALSAGFIYLMNTNEAFSGKVNEVWDAVSSKISSVVNIIKPLISDIFARAITDIQAFAPAFESAFATIQTIITTLADAFSAFFSGLIGGFKDGLSGAEGFGNAFSMILGLISPPLKAILLLFQNFGPEIVNLVSIIGSNLVPVFSTLGATIGGIASAIIPALQSAFANLAPVMVNVLSVGTQLIDSVIQILSMALPIVINLITQLAPFLVQIVSLIGQVVSALAPMISQLAGALVPVISEIIQIIETVFKVIMNVVKAAMPAVISIMNVVMSIIKAVVPVLTNIISTISAIVSAVISAVSGIMAAISPIISFIGMVITTIVSIISPIITFVMNVVATIIQVVGTIASAVSGVCSTIASVFASAFKVVSGIFSNIYDVASGIFDAIGTIVSALAGTFGNVFNSIYSIVSSVMGNVQSFISGVFAGIQSSWNGLTSFVSGVFDGIGNAVQTLVDTVTGFINGVISGINSAISLINKIPGVEIGEIPYLAHGTDNWQGGFAYMNEGGRGELTYLPNGSQVIPHDISVKYARESARANAAADPIDVSTLGEYIVSAMIEYGNRQGQALEKGISNMGVYFERRPFGRVIADMGFVRG